jgi:hypothetical protein
MEDPLEEKQVKTRAAKDLVPGDFLAPGEVVDGNAALILNVEHKSSKDPRGNFLVYFRLFFTKPGQPCGQILTAYFYSHENVKLIC